MKIVLVSALVSILFYVIYVAAGIIMEGANAPNFMFMYVGAVLGVTHTFSLLAAIDGK